MAVVDSFGSYPTDKVGGESSKQPYDKQGRINQESLKQSCLSFEFIVVYGHFGKNGRPSGVSSSKPNGNIFITIRFCNVNLEFIIMYYNNGVRLFNKLSLF